MQTHIEWAVSSTGTVHPQTHTHSESLVPLVPPQAALVRLRSLVLSSLARLNAIQQSQLDHSLSFLDSPSSLRSISAHLTRKNPRTILLINFVFTNKNLFSRGVFATKCAGRMGIGSSVVFSSLFG